MIYYYKKTQRDSNIFECKPTSLGSWISIVSPTQKEIDNFSEKYNIPKEFLLSSLDAGELSRIDKERGVILFIFKIPLREDSVNGGFSTNTLGIIITNRHIITVTSENHPILEDFIESKIKNCFTTSRNRFLLQIINRVDFYFINYLHYIENKIDIVEEKLLSSFENKEVVSLLKYQKSLTFFDTAVLTNNNVLEKLAKGNVIELNKEDKELLDDIIVDNKQALEMINVYGNILSNTMDAYASIISNNLNIVMKFLASVTILISFPTIIASFFGMNVRLPFQDHPLAFFIIIFISIITIIGFAYIFSKKKYF